MRIGAPKAGGVASHTHYTVKGQHLKVLKVPKLAKMNFKLSKGKKTSAGKNPLKMKNKFTI